VIDPPPPRRNGGIDQVEPIELDRRPIPLCGVACELGMEVLRNGTGRLASPTAFAFRLSGIRRISFRSQESALEDSNGSQQSNWTLADCTAGSVLVEALRMRLFLFREYEYRHGTLRSTKTQRTIQQKKRRAKTMAVRPLWSACRRF